MTAPASALRRTARAFTLVEVMIVVVIIGLLAAIAIPALQRVKRAAQTNRIANDLRVFAQAFETYALQNGFWPNNTGSGVVPTAPVSMAGDFKTDVWRSDTAVGGRWNWDRNMNGYAASISIAGFTCTDAQLTEIDAKIDDGDLTTGNFIKVTENRVSYILER